MSSLRGLSPVPSVPVARPILPVAPGICDRFEAGGSDGMLPKVFAGVGLVLTLAGVAQVQLQPAPVLCEPSPSQQCYTNAVLTKSAPDPGVVKVGEQWYLTHTG